MNIARNAVASLSALALVPAGTRGQAPAEKVRIQIESQTGSNLGGSLVALVDSANQIAVEGVSSAEGKIQLAAPAGAYRVRVRRIGYRPFYSNPVALPHPSLLKINVESPRVVLDVLVVSEKSKCGSIEGDTQTLSDLWEEISKALQASQLTMHDLSAVRGVYVYQRELDKFGNVVVSDSTFVMAGTSRPFGARDPERLANEGYVRGNVEAGWEYFAPDERVLLSDSFASTHCFRALRDPARRSQLGLAFTPAPKRKQTEISGTLWVDESTSELREIIFSFVNAGILNKFKPTGYTQFIRMASGAWIVSKWNLKMPLLQLKLAAIELSSDRWTNSQLSGYVERGGRLVLK